MRRFNVTGLCVANKHYMVDISGKLEQIGEMIDNGDYFTINRARQYGKTTTLSLLRRTLFREYTVASISFEGLGDESFATPEAFCHAFMELVRDSLRFTDASGEYISGWYDEQITTFQKLNGHITGLCRDKKVLLLIDEVDKTSNNRVFLHFLGMLRNKYLKREDGMDYTFHSVILAGVYDVRNIKLKMRFKGAYSPLPEESRLYNSPWNIAVNFTVDMSFSPAEIATMLAQYESDHHTGMDVASISEEIHNYTDGYPFLGMKNK